MFTEHKPARSLKSAGIGQLKPNMVKWLLAILLPTAGISSPRSLDIPQL